MVLEKISAEASSNLEKLSSIILKEAPNNIDEEINKPGWVYNPLIPKDANAYFLEASSNGNTTTVVFYRK